MEGNLSYKFQEGDWVIVVDKKMRKRMFKIRADRRFSVYGREFPHQMLIGRYEGEKLDLDGRYIYLFRPSMRDYVLNVKRNAQPIYPKDLGLLLYYANIGWGSCVLEIGLGVGALSIAILNVIGPNGRLVTYERRSDFAKEGRKRVEEFLGPCENFNVVIKDACDGIEERGFDAAFIDIPEPWSVIENVAMAVRFGAYVLAFIPTAIQVKQYWDKLKQINKFYEIEIIETLLRPWDASTFSLRPTHRMVAHTGFIVIARRTYFESKE